MKKVLLTSVAALAVFAAAAPAFADNSLTKGDGSEKIPHAGYVENNDKEATFNEINDLRKEVEGARSEDWTKGDAQANVNAGGKAGNVVKVDKGEAAAPAATQNPAAKAEAAKAAAKAPAAAGTKALPKTSAVK